MWGMVFCIQMRMTAKLVHREVTAYLTKASHQGRGPCADGQMFHQLIFSHELLLKYHDNCKMFMKRMI